MQSGLVPQSITEQLLYTTVKITNADSQCSGTGFFFNFQLEDGNTLALILTNKHVIDTSRKISFYLHEATTIDRQPYPTGNSFEFICENVQTHWFPHPDVNIDLGALLFDPIAKDVSCTLNKSIYQLAFDKSHILDDQALLIESSVADDILMIGYPIGLWDDHNNMPIFRKGITATHPALNFKNNNIGLVDVACYPGSSGSPILIYKEGAMIDKNNNIKTGIKKILLGLLFAGPPYLNQAKIMNTDELLHPIPIIEITQMIHLGFYVKAKEILILSKYISSKIKNTPS